MIIRTEDIFATIEAMPQFVDAPVVLCYWSVKDEVPTHAFLDRWFGRKKMVLPVVKGESLLLREYHPDGMVRGAFGIMEPSSDCPVVDPSEIAFAIIPGEAFDPSGNRKGHGKGYYDRLLPSVHCFKAGVAPAHKIVSHLDPAPWDVPVDVVVTQSRPCPF